MEVYLTGQINEADRGNLSVIIAQEPKKPGDTFSQYGIFVTETSDEQFNFLTGTRTLHCPIERVYIGLNHDAADRLARLNFSLNTGSDIPSDLDKLVVQSYFLPAPV